MTVEILQGDCIEVLRTLPAESVHCCVTSPPYWGLRDYGTAKWEGGDHECDHKGSKPETVAKSRASSSLQGSTETVHISAAYKEVCGRCGATRVDEQLGLEATPDEYVAKMVQVFREVRRVLRDDGTLWLNLGDTYAGSWGAMSYAGGDIAGRRFGGDNEKIGRPVSSRLSGDLKPKDLVGIPWMVAFALRADGWWLRQDIIWHKPNPMPESVTDRCTKAHEYIFLLSKSEKYYYNAELIAEDCADSSLERWDQDIDAQEGSDRVPGKTNGTMKAVGGPRSHKGSNFHTGKTGEHQQGRSSTKPRKVNGGASFGKQNHSVDGTGAQSRTYERPVYEKRNRRSVWTVTTKPYKAAHFATFPPDLIQPCILAGCPETTCPTCGTAINWNYENTVVPVVQKEVPDIPVSQGAEQVLQPSLFDREQENTTGKLPGVRAGDSVYQGNCTQQVLQQGLCESGNIKNEIDNEGLCNNSQGVQSALPSRPSYGNAGGLRYGASRGDGEENWQESASTRGCSPQEREQDRQPDIQSRTSNQSCSRQEAKADTQSNCRVSVLRSKTPPLQQCPHCHEILAHGDLCPGVVLDPFLGSGTTALVAQRNGCYCIGIELNPEYVKLAERRVRQRMLL